MFADIGENDNRMRVEDALLINCHPLTLGQRCADWFLLKVLISGTLAGKIISVVNREGADTIVGSVEKKRDIIQICFGSWFKRHNSNADMTTGTENEEPTIQKLRKEKFMRCLFDVGLLQSNEHWSLGVSPDGLCILNSDDSLNDSVACVEIKTRVKPLTIEKAETARRQFGRVVWCYYDDETFKKCVPSENRQQVLHQAAVTKLSVGVFVTAKVEENQGSIVQIIIAKITSVQRITHIHKLLPVAEAIVE